MTLGVKGLNAKLSYFFKTIMLSVIFLTVLRSVTFTTVMRSVVILIDVILIIAGAKIFESEQSNLTSV